jgi:predicted nucleic acid-binding protein
MLVVDTSVAIKWVVREDGESAEADTRAALAILDNALIAPDFMAVEFGNVLWKKVRRNEIGADHARASLDILATMISFLPTHGFAARALEIGLELGHPVYDCLFIAVAEAHGAPLITADRKLVRQCGGTRFAPLLIDLSTEASR